MAQIISDNVSGLLAVVNWLTWGLSVSSKCNVYSLYSVVLDTLTENT